MTNKYNNILVIDSSTRILRLGLQFGGDRLIQSNEKNEKSHGQFIIKKIGELFQSASLEMKDLDAIVVGLGPGSFTGLRIGLAAAKGIAVALDIPIVGVDSFEQAAYWLKNVEETICVIVPLNRDESICGFINFGQYNKNETKIIKYCDLFNEIGNMAIAAVGFDLMEKFPDMENHDVSYYLKYEASDLVYLGLEKLNNGDVANVATLEPMYLQKSQAEIRFDQRRKENK